MFKYLVCTNTSLPGAHIEVASLVCNTSAYRPAIFTAGDDDSVGETLAVTWGDYQGSINPGTYYANPALMLYNSTSLNNVRFRYCSSAVQILDFAQASYTVSHSQFVQCMRGIVLGDLGSGGSSYGGSGGGSLNLNNCLMSQVAYAVDASWPLEDWYGKVTHCTFDQSTRLITVGVYGATTFWFTNSIFADISTLASGTCYVYGAHNGFYAAGSTFGSDPVVESDPPSPFAPVGYLDGNNESWYYVADAQGGHYLRDGSPFTDAGTPNISQSLKDELNRRTTVVPQLFNYDVNSSQTLSPTAIRDTDTPDLGYHYPVVDYVVCGATVNNCTLNIDQGTVLGFTTPYYEEGRNEAVRVWYPYNLPWYEWGIRLNPGGRLNVNGVPTNRVVFARLEAVQESPVFPSSWGEWCPVVTFKGVVAPSGPVTPLAEASIHYADFPTLAGYSCHFGDLYPDYTYDLVHKFELDGCAFGSGWLIYESGGVLDRSFILRNNVFERTSIDIEDFWSDHGTEPEVFVAGNNLFYYPGEVDFVPAAGASWIFTDNIFDHASLDPGWNGPVAENHHNAYVGMNTRLTPTLQPTTDPILASLTYQTGPLGSFYLPTTATAVIDTGSQTAAAASLYHFTSFTSNVKEATTQVNIGPHYLALVSGGAADSNGDGVPDFLADRNGDGIENSDEMPWSSANSGTLTILAPANNLTVSGIVQLKVALGASPLTVPSIVPYVDGARVVGSLSVISPAESIALIEIDTRNLSDDTHTISVGGYQTQSGAIALTTANDFGFADWERSAEEEINVRLKVPTASTARVWFFDDSYAVDYDPFPVSHADLDPSSGTLNFDETLSALSLDNAKRVFSVTELDAPAGPVEANPDTTVLDKWPSGSVGKWVVSYEDDGAEYYTIDSNPNVGTDTKIADYLDYTGEYTWLYDSQLDSGWWQCGIDHGGVLISTPNARNGHMAGGVWIPNDKSSNGGTQTWPVRSFGLKVQWKDSSGKSEPYNLDFKHDIEKLQEYLARPDARNFYGRGHGPDKRNEQFFFFRIPVEKWKFVNHRYRFVFLDGCQTANQVLLTAFGLRTDEWNKGKTLKDLYGLMSGPMRMTDYPHPTKRPGLFLGHRSDGLVGLYVDPVNHTPDPGTGCAVRSYDALCNWHWAFIGYLDISSYDFIHAANQASQDTFVANPIYPFPDPDFQNGKVWDPGNGYITYKPDDCLKVFGYGNLKLGDYNAASSTWP